MTERDGSYEKDIQCFRGCFDSITDALCWCSKCRPGGWVDIKPKTPRYTCCDDRSCDLCQFWGDVAEQLKHHKAAPEGLSERVRQFDQETRDAIVARSLRRFLSNRSSAQGITLRGATWVLSGSRAWDHGSRMGSSAQEIGEIS